jgi:MFS family permease
MSVQAVVIILPTIGRELNIPEARVQWVVSAYSLAFGCLLLLWGRIADIFGRRKIFILGSAWVAITTAVNPFLPNEIAFDLFRALQGLVSLHPKTSAVKTRKTDGEKGAAANVPTAIGILTTTFPPGKAKNYAISCYGTSASSGGLSEK